MVNSRELLAKMKEQLPRNSEFEAIELLTHFTGSSRAALLRGDPVSKENEQRVFDAVLRRKSGEPLQYILGQWEFDGITILCKPGVLIPREDTLCLVEQAEKSARELFPVGSRLRILDIGCGSGCVGLSLVKRLQKEYDVSLLSVDVKQECLELTQENAILWGIGDKVQVQRFDIFEEIPAGTFDVLVSNPPYIKTVDIESLDAEVRAYEPHAALDGGEDGLLFYRRIVKSMKELVPHGVVAVETGFDTGEDVKTLFKVNGYIAAELYRDKNGQPRVVCTKI